MGDVSDDRAAEYRRALRERERAAQGDERPAYTYPLPLALRGPTDEPWRADAACRTMGPKVFYPEWPNIGGRAGNGAQRREAEAPAKTVCGGCVVSSDCLTWAIEWGVHDGIHGGLNSAERAVVARQRRENERRSAERGYRLEETA